MDDYIICQGPDDLKETVRNCQSVLTIVPLESAPDSGTVEQNGAPDTDAIKPGELVTVKIEGGATMTGQLHAILGETVIVHVWCFGRVLPLTTQRAALKRVELPEAWR
ncbi:MAG: hypothetical protein AB1411_02655 [Nitrospirota bacterium]